jgi:hypothetical protein
MARRHARRNVEQWRNEPTAAVEIEAHLESYGVDASSINIEVFVQGRDLFLMFDAFRSEPSGPIPSGNCCSPSAFKATSMNNSADLPTRQRAAVNHSFAIFLQSPACGRTRG